MIYQGWDWSIVVSQGLYIKINWSIKDKIDLLLSHKGYILRLIDLSRMRMIYCWFTLLNADIFKIIINQGCDWSILDSQWLSVKNISFFTISIRVKERKWYKTMKIITQPRSVHSINFQMHSPTCSRYSKKYICRLSRPKWTRI